MSYQEEYDKLCCVYEKIKAQDVEQARKLKRAILAVVESFEKRLEEE